VSVLGCDIIGHREKKEVRMNMCVIANGYRDEAV